MGGLGETIEQRSRRGPPTSTFNEFLVPALILLFLIVDLAVGDTVEDLEDALKANIARHIEARAFPISELFASLRAQVTPRRTGDPEF